MMFCAVLHIGPPIVFFTLLVSDPATAQDLTPWGLLWTALLLAYDWVRMGRYRG
jgi:hypothetical protein